ncbi:zinc finger protein 64-like [Coccinella septempunctata]|uniref:zinc finger protein 64-like n=1 Tax=Coccinella septempunctata TaxID=41139 RepID=UPI001D062084|nr:zinc finger protein 64-like [Coccinella septempunctata]
MTTTSKDIKTPTTMAAGNMYETTGGLEKSDYDEQYSNEECEIKIEEEDIYKRITKREADENNINFDGQSTKILMRQYSDSANVDEQLKLKERKCDFTTCLLCDYAAKRRGYLKVHIENVHMNLKKDQCAMCDYKTCVKNSLKMHISSVHLQLKQFKCDSCEYIAKRKCTLRDHVEAVHLNLKNHRCEKCPYSTQRKTTLNDHI